MNKYQNNYKYISIQLHKVKDGDIIKHMNEINNMQFYIKELIRKEIKNESSINTKHTRSSK